MLISCTKCGFVKLIEDSMQPQSIARAIKNFYEMTCNY